MSDEQDGKLERQEPKSIEVRRFHGEEGNPNQLGITRRGGILATDRDNPRESGLDAFKGRELLRRVSKR